MQCAIATHDVNRAIAGLTKTSDLRSAIYALQKITFAMRCIFTAIC